MAWDWTTSDMAAAGVESAKGRMADRLDTKKPGFAENEAGLAGDLSPVRL
jgi:hypothetical protein